MGQAGILFYVENTNKASLKDTFENMGFEVEDMWEELNESDREIFRYVYKIRKDGFEWLVDVQGWDSGGDCLAVHFCREKENEEEYLKELFGDVFKRIPAIDG